jgi:hypothetical protein
MIASIHLIQPTSSQGGSTGGSSSPGSGGGSGGGIGEGGGLNQGSPGGAGFSFLQFPNFSFNFPWNFSFQFPNFFHFPSANLTLPQPSTPAITNNGGQTGSSGGNSGSQGSSGPSGEIVTKTNAIPQFVIPSELLIIAVVVALILAGTAFVISQRKNLLGRRRQSAALVQSPELAVLEQRNANSITKFDPSTELLGEEKIVDYAGWGASSGFVRPDIPKDLPLIWALDEPLKVEAPSGTKFSLEGAEVAAAKNHNESSVVLVFETPCNHLTGISGGSKDEKWIRAVKYDEDVTKLFRLNLIDSSGLDLKSMTARELAYHMITQKGDLVKRSDDLIQVTKIFERAFYGKKGIKRSEYESFLRGLTAALNSPKVIICGPREQHSADRQ